MMADDDSRAQTDGQTPEKSEGQRPGPEPQDERLGQEAGDQRPLTEEERAEIYRQQLKELRMLDVARDMMLTIVTVGYQKLGLTEETRELRDLSDAKLAVELLRAIIGAVEGTADEEELKSYRSTLAQMQLNFARVAAE
jgi:hypothetical protein